MSSSSHSKPYSISKLSNGLQFSKGAPTFKQSKSAELFSAAPPGPSDSPVKRDTPGKTTTPPRALYQSLIPKTESRDTRLERRVRTSRDSARLLSPAASIRSTISSIFSLRSGTKRPKLHLFDLPIELLDEIIGTLGQPALLQLLTVSRLVSSLTVRHLYFEPQFQSTYRFAQFVTTVSHNSDLASYVKVLDLSSIPERTRPGTHEVLAGWRDWKLRNEPLYSRPSLNRTTPSLNTLALSPAASLSSENSHHRASKSHQRQKSESFTIRKLSGLLKTSKLSSEPAPPKRRKRALSLVTNATNAPSAAILPVAAQGGALVNAYSQTTGSSASFKHPTQSSLLRQYSNSNDTPRGALLHILHCCQNLLIVDLSGLPLANDYYISSERYPPTASSGYIFVSDVSQLYSWSRNHIRSVAASDIIDALCALKHLTTLSVRSATWLSERLVVKLLRESGAPLSKLDFRNSGLARDLDWAVQGDQTTLRRALSIEK